MNGMRDKTAHFMAPEEVMAYLDGELATDEAEAVAAHLRDCGECAAVAEELRGVSRAMDGWAVEPVPVSLEREVRLAAKENETGKGNASRSAFGRGWMWALGSALLVLFVVGMVMQGSHRRSRMMLFLNPEEDPGRVKGVVDSAQQDVGNDADAPRSAGGVGVEGRNFASLEQIAPGVVAQKVDQFGGGGGGGGTPATYKAQGPMIARTVSLTVLVKNVAEARRVLDALVTRQQGYAAQLTFSTPEAGARSLQASLRVPASELAKALEELRKLGRVQGEMQSGEEVTQQHADLVARLKNSREEEGRLRDLLQQRTGKIEDVLQVEEEIARVRGEIEGMEAEQKGLEHRVDFASVDLRLVEEYTARLGTPAEGAGTRVHNSFVAGVRNAGGSLLGMLLFLEEVGPVLLIWGLIIGVPGWLLWRRYRRISGLG